MAAAVLSAGCTLITDVDRSKIPAAEIVPPDPPPPQPVDAGEPASDAGAVSDAGDAAPAPGPAPVTPDAGGSGVPDAGAPDSGAAVSDAG